MKIKPKAYLVTAALILAVFGVASAQDYEYVDYTIQKGDTLWSISSAQLKDSFMWPQLWEQNDQIKNPDRIYPGEKIRIPKSWLKQAQTTLKEVKKEIEAAAPKPVEPPKPVVVPVATRSVQPLASRELVLSYGYITDSVPDKGELKGSTMGSVVDRKYFSYGDEVFVKTSAKAEAGDKFYVIRDVTTVRVPGDWFSIIGHHVRVMGTVQLEDPGTNDLKARVVESFGDIKTGDKLDTYYEADPPYITGEPRKPQINGARIVASADMRNVNGMEQTVFIDKGENDGVKVGDIYMLLAAGTSNKRNGTIQVISVRGTTALAIITESIMPVAIGDPVTGYIE
jgi:LysM repeat protein